MKGKGPARPVCSLRIPVASVLSEHVAFRFSRMTRTGWWVMLIVLWSTFLFFFNILFIYFFREREREGEREGGKHPCVVASRVPPTGDLAHNPGMCPDWESNQRPFGSQAGAQSTEPHQPGLIIYFSSYCLSKASYVLPSLVIGSFPELENAWTYI